ncbi:MAG: hypothetical protein ACTS3F_14655 [Phycisphaerales bacterium]
MPNPKPRTSLHFAIPCLAVAAALATASAEPDPNDADLLRGPSVSQPTAPPTLVNRGFDGELILIEGRPEYAALRLLTFDPSHQAAIDEVVLARTSDTHAIAIEHAALVLRIRTTLSARDPDAIARLMRELREAFAPLLEPTLESRLAGAMEEPTRSEFLRIVREYKQALAGEPSQRMMGAGVDSAMEQRRGPRGRAEQLASRRMEMQLTIVEVLSAYRAAVEDSTERRDALYDAIDATPEQREKIRTLLGEGSALLGNGERRDTTDRRRVIAEVLALLTPEQRRKAAAYFRDAAPPAR